MSPLSLSSRTCSMAPLLLLLLTSCSARQFGAQRSSPSLLSSVVQPSSLLKKSSNIQHRQHAASSLLAAVPSGGGGEDYTSAAQGLFGNIIGPASMLTGGLVPLGFTAPSLPKDHPKLKSAYSLVAVFSLANVILAIIYGTVSCNKLVEVPHDAASSVFELIQRDYELSWIGTNVHFIGSLSGFLIMVGIRAYTLFPDSLRLASTGIAASVMLLSLSIINRGIAKGDGSGRQLSSGIVALLARYVCLLWKEMVSNRSGPIEIGAILLFVSSCALAVRGTAVVTEKDTQQ